MTVSCTREEPHHKYAELCKNEHLFGCLSPSSCVPQAAPRRGPAAHQLLSVRRWRALGGGACTCRCFLLRQHQRGGRAGADQADAVGHTGRPGKLETEQSSEWNNLSCSNSRCWLSIPVWKFYVVCSQKSCTCGFAKTIAISIKIHVTESFAKL